ncbi:MAG: TadE family protein [Peptococcia bacterium]
MKTIRFKTIRFKTIRFSFSEKGSTTIEVALVVSALLIILMALIFSFMLMHQKLYLRSTAAAVAQEAADLWVKDNGLYERILSDNFLSGDQGISFEYSRLISPEDNQGSSEDFYNRKFSQINGLIIERLQKTLRNPEKTTVVIKYDNNFLSKRITIELNQEMNIPLGSLRGLFGGTETFTLTESASSAITDPTELIRNIDLGLEYATKATGKIKIKDLIMKLTTGAEK